MLIFDCVVIGGGVAGMTAALYLKRSNLNVLLLEKSAPGGKLNNIYKIENYPGFDEIEGPILSMNIYNQIISNGVEYKYGNVINVIDKNDYKIIKTDVETIKCKSVIIASGRIPRKLGLENEEELIGKGVGFCALCDGTFYKDKKVAVVGGGNSAITDAIYLANICKEVVIIHRRDSFTAEKVLQEKLKEYKNITKKYNSVVKTLIKKDNKLIGLKLKSGKTIGVDGLFINIGYIPDTKYLKELSLKLENNYIVVNDKMQTNIKNIYACGDVIKKDIYQITTAVSDGTIAAISVKEDIN